VNSSPASYARNEVACLESTLGQMRIVSA